MRELGEVTPVGRIVSENTAFGSPFYKVVERVVETPDGQIREPQLLQDLQGKKFAAAVITTAEGKILFVKEPKYGQMDYFLVVPTGAIKKGEDPTFAAARETLEETGYLAQNFKVINPRVVSKPDKSDGGEHIILVAENAQKVQEPEQLREVIELTKEEVEQLLDNEITNLQLEVDISRLSVLEYLRHINKLKKKDNPERQEFFRAARSVIDNIDQNLILDNLWQNQDFLKLYDEATSEERSFLTRILNALRRNYKREYNVEPTISDIKSLNQNKIDRMHNIGPISQIYINGIFLPELDSSQETQ